MVNVKVSFYETVSGRSPVEDFLYSCSQDIQADFFDAIALLSAGETIQMPLSRNLSNIFRGLHELRLKDRTGQFRFLYLIKTGDGIFVIHGFKKKTQRLPQKELELVLKRIKEIS